MLQRIQCINKRLYLQPLIRCFCTTATLKHIDEIPGNFGGEEINKYIDSPFTFWENKRNEYGDIFKLRMNGVDQIITLDLKLMIEAYTFELFNKCKRGYPESHEQLIGDSFVRKARPPTHREWRKDWNPIFNKKQVIDYSQMIENESISLLNNIMNESLSNYIDIYPLISDYSLDCSIQIWLGPTILNEIKNSNNLNILYSEYNQWNDGYYVIGNTQYEQNIWNTSIAAFKNVTEILDFCINRANELYLDDKLERNTVLYKFLSKDKLNKYWNTKKEDIDPFWSQDVGELLAINMTDAFNTPLFQNLFYILSQDQYKEHVDKLRYKLLENDIVYNIDDISTLIQKVPYLEYFSRELLRYFPTSTLFYRETLKDVEFNGYFLPKGTFIASPIIYFNYSDKYWDKPKLFNPQRFDPINSNKNNSKAFLSFSSGNRKCLGKDLVLMEVNVFLATFIKNNYKIQSYVTGDARYPFNSIPINAKVTKD